MVNVHRNNQNNGKEIDRSAFLKLPIADRRRILEQQAETALPYYQQDTEWQEWLNLDIAEIHA
jgi:hypothetical protein